ncbi:MAG: 50S ribosomal protein L10 [Acidimicrobiia bacterium]|nr:MAG: 50S ribosomal protein L10 [Acidimicrobiia bacterium]
MPRPEKVQAVAELKQRLAEARAVFLTEFRGLTVSQMQQLRRNLRQAGAEYKVVKMTLARRAAAEVGLDGLDELLVGPTALAFADDPVTVAKVLRDASRDSDKLVIKGGILAGSIIPPEQVSKLAEIEPREVLLAKIAGAAKAPLYQMAGLMAALTRNTAWAIAQLLEKKESGAVPAGTEEE